MRAEPFLTHRAGVGWRRQLWSELAARLDVDPYAIDVPPCVSSFPYRSWPANIAPPAEGSLDREQFVHLLEHLAAVTSGYETICTAYYSPFNSGDWEGLTVFRCELQELTQLYDEDLAGAPNNLWPDDHSWLTFTDWDLWATKVSGGRDLMNRLTADPELGPSHSPSSKRTTILDRRV